MGLRQINYNLLSHRYNMHAHKESFDTEKIYSPQLCQDLKTNEVYSLFIFKIEEVTPQELNQKSAQQDIS